MSAHDGDAIIGCLWLGGVIGGIAAELTFGVMWVTVAGYAIGAVAGVIGGAALLSRR